MKLEPPFQLVGQHIGAVVGAANALFTTRVGGCSEGSYGGLNLGAFTDDDQQAVYSNRIELAESIGCESELLLWAEQVHGQEIETVNASGAQRLKRADGFITTTPGLVPMVTVADCLPVVILSETAVGAFHAGWKGLVAEILPAAVSEFARLGVPAENLTALVGPAIGPCCFEVSDDLRTTFAAWPQAQQESGNIDLKLVAKQQLEVAGVKAVHDVGICNACADPELFYSYRRDAGVTGRQVGVAWLS